MRLSGFPIWEMPKRRKWGQPASAQQSAEWSHPHLHLIQIRAEIGRYAEIHLDHPGDHTRCGTGIQDVRWLIET
jgi:hypothetical protein